MAKGKFNKLEAKAKEFRNKVLDLSLEKGEGHLGGGFSAIEILLSLFDIVLKEEDKFILSKGHACYPLYILLREKGYDPVISGHPDLDEKNNIHATTGSLGHGLPIAVGMALARKKQRKKGKIYVLMSDGECQEGTVWESSDIAAYHKLDNLTVIVDNNQLQALDKIKNISPMNLNNKFKEFGWYVSEINGHSFPKVIKTLERTAKEKPCMIIANTIKGKGVSYMENEPKWHNRLPNNEELNQAYQELK